MCDLVAPGVGSDADPRPGNPIAPKAHGSEPGPDARGAAGTVRGDQDAGPGSPWNKFVRFLYAQPIGSSNPNGDERGASPEPGPAPQPEREPDPEPERGPQPEREPEPRKTSRRRIGGVLWGHRDFRLVWAGESISSLGSQVSQLALPLIAVRALHASVIQIGGLSAAEGVAMLVAGLPAGVWVDRLRRRPLLIAADLGSMAGLASVPVAAATGVLGLPQLYVVAFVTGVMSVVFGVAWQPYLPVLIDKEHLVEGNAKMNGTSQAAAVAGPSVAGFLVQAVGGAYAVLVDAVSFLVSAAALARVRTAEPPLPAQPAGGRRRMRSEIVEGLGYLFADPLLRMLTASVTVANFAFSIMQALSVVFLVRALHQAPGALGLLFAAGGVGGVIGAMTASPGARRVGASRVTLAGLALADLGLALLPLAHAGPRLALFAAGEGLVSWGIVVFNVTMASFRQRLVPNRLMGRVVASQRVIMWGSAPLGSLIGGVLGETIGVRGGLWVAAVAFLPSLAILLATPLRTVRDLPATPDEVGPPE